jgi:hypothetical protein
MNKMIYTFVIGFLCIELGHAMNMCMGDASIAGNQFDSLVQLQEQLTCSTRVVTSRTVLDQRLISRTTVFGYQLIPGIVSFAYRRGHRKPTANQEHRYTIYFDYVLVNPRRVNDRSYLLLLIRDERLRLSKGFKVYMPVLAGGRDHPVRNRALTGMADYLIPKCGDMGKFFQSNFQDYVNEAALRNGVNLSGVKEFVATP